MRVVPRSNESLPSDRLNSQRRETRRTSETLFSLAWLHQRNTSGSTTTDLGRGMKQICHLNLMPPTHVCNLREHTQHVFQSEVAIFDSHAFCSDHRLGVRWEFTAHVYFRGDVTLRITRLFLTTSVVSRPFLLWKLLSLSFEVSVTLPVFFFFSPPLSLYTIVFLLASCVLIVHSYRVGRLL